MIPESFVGLSLNRAIEPWEREGKGMSVEVEWQPVRIAPIENWCPGLARDHWAAEKVGQIVRVKPTTHVHMGCDCRERGDFTLHPDDQATLSDMFRHDTHVGCAYCQIQAD